MLKKSMRPEDGVARVSADGGDQEACLEHHGGLSKRDCSIRSKRSGLVLA